MGLAPARGAPRVGDSAPRVPAALVLSDLLWLILYNFSQTEIREGGFALFWTRPAAADRPLGPRRAAPAEDGLLAPAGRQPLHRWAAQVCSAGALGLLPSLPLRSRLGHGQGSVRGDRRPGQRWDQMPWGPRGPCSAGQCLGQRGGARRCRSRIRKPSGRAPLPGGASWLQRLALWRLPPPDAAFPPALDLRQQKGRFPEQHQRLSLGCPVLDGLLRGGLPLGGITELAGRSSAGKTQLALQLCLAVQFPWRLGGLEAGECRPVVEGRGGCTRSPCGSDGHCPSWLGPGLAPAVFLSRGCAMPPGSVASPAPRGPRGPGLWAGLQVPPFPGGVTHQPAGSRAPWLPRGRVRVHGGRVPRQAPAAAHSAAAASADGCSGRRGGEDQLWRPHLHRARGRRGEYLPARQPRAEGRHQLGPAPHRQPPGHAAHFPGRKAVVTGSWFGAGGGEREGLAEGREVGWLSSGLASCCKNCYTKNFTSGVRHINF